MRLFHISDVLSITTGRLVSLRHMEGVYDILNFMTGGELFTHQLPRASDECTPTLRAQFPQLFPEEPLIASALVNLGSLMVKGDTKEQQLTKLEQWVENLRIALALPVMLPVNELGTGIHAQVNPIEELATMIGHDKVIVVNTNL